MVGIVTALGISLHNFPEGIAVYLTCLRGLHTGLGLCIAIAAHNIPEGVAVAIPIYSATLSRWQAFKWSALSGLCEPIGALIVATFATSFLTPHIIQASLAAVAGIMVFMCISELIPATLKYIEPKSAVRSHIAGMVFIFITVHFLHITLHNRPIW